ncbi:MAG: penicillin-binding transpeptidase domain-containing protein [Solirubrobacterales bacterium]
MSCLPPEVERRRRLVTRGAPLALIALIAFIAGAMAGVPPTPEKDAAKRFTEAWARQDFAAMQAELNPASARQTSASDLATAYLDAQRTATLRTLDPGDPSDPSSREGTTVVSVPVTVGTIAFGTIEADLEIPFSDGGVQWEPSLVFPGLRPGDRLENRIRLAPRAPILARRGAPMAEGPADARTHPLGSAMIDVTGEVGEADPSDEDALAAQGFPPGTPVGISGVEQAFNRRLAGRPGGKLLAVPSDGGEPRVLGEAKPAPGRAVRTTIDPTVQNAAVAGLAGRSGGVAALDARNGAVRALAGQAFSAPQPPGSTFKIITTTSALQEGAVSLDDTFPYTNGVNVGGRFIYNANGEVCGGDFRTAFAESCNAVFVPLGPKVGNDALVGTAERYGFNEAPTLYDEAATSAVDPPTPSIPQDVGAEVDLGVTAIGQGEVLATPLEMASVAQTVANRGVRLPTPLVAKKELQAKAGPVRVTSKKITDQLTELMIGVVNSGTGIAGAIPEGQVAGKTGTAELGPVPGQENLPNPEQIVDAWFAAFAPASKPKLAVAVMLIDAGAAGGEVAAPIAAQVLSAGL